MPLREMEDIVAGCIHGVTEKEVAKWRENDNRDWDGVPQTNRTYYIILLYDDPLLGTRVCTHTPTHSPYQTQTALRPSLLPAPFPCRGPERGETTQGHCVRPLRSRDQGEAEGHPRVPGHWLLPRPRGAELVGEREGGPEWGRHGPSALQGVPRPENLQLPSQQPAEGLCLLLAQPPQPLPLPSPLPRARGEGPEKLDSDPLLPRHPEHQCRDPGQSRVWHLLSIV